MGENFKARKDKNTEMMMKILKFNCYWLTAAQNQKDVFT
eukprot:UN15781